MISATNAAWSAGLLALAISLLLTPALAALLSRLEVLDHPNARSSHDTPIARGGGIAVATACIIGWLLVTRAGPSHSSLGILVGASALGVIGLAEDLRGIPALPRLLLHTVGAAVACAWLLRDLQGPLLWQVTFGGGALVWLVAYANGFNFMDGINGISGVQSLIAGLTWAWLGHLRSVDELVWAGLILGGASLGFLPFNFPRARVFLGDSGSYFIGGWQAATLVVGFRAGVPPEAMLAPLLLYLADTGLTLGRRAMTGQQWHEPHREHFYQQLVRLGWSHSKTTTIVGAFMTLISLAGLLALNDHPIRWAAGIAMACVLACYLLLPTLAGRKTRPPMVAGT